MTWLTKRTETEALPDGTVIKSKKNGSIGVIEGQCGCGNSQWLHDEVKPNKGLEVYQHLEIERLFEVIND